MDRPYILIIKIKHYNITNLNKVIKDKNNYKLKVQKSNNYQLFKKTNKIITFNKILIYYVMFGVYKILIIILIYIIFFKIIFKIISNHNLKIKNVIKKIKLNKFKLTVLNNLLVFINISKNVFIKTKLIL
jgi:hypothetical protein